MLRKNLIIISALLFFVVINTSYFWDSMLGLYSFPAFMLLMLLFFVLAVVLVFQIVHGISEKFKSKHRLLTISVLTIVLVTSFLMPTGMVNFHQFEEESVLSAEREGVANCMTTFKLYADGQFKETSVCFGTTEVKGKVNRIGDTLLFEEVHLGRHKEEYYKFAVIQKSQFKSSHYSADLMRYKNFGDTIGDVLWIYRNKLENK